MIPYDDLVVALQTWRARQGLPVAQLANLAPASAAPAPVAVPRTNPPAPPARVVTAPPPLAPPPDTHDEVEESALIEEAHYENEGDDFAMAFGQNQSDESTSVGSVPAPDGRDSFGGSTEPEPPPAKHDNNTDDW